MPLETSELSLGELFTNSKGAKSVSIFCNDDRLLWRPGPLKVHWQPKAFNDPSAMRVSICFQTTDAVESYFKQLEEWATNQIAKNPMKYLGQYMTAEQIKERWTSAIKVSAKGYPHLRCKMNVEGRNAVRCWDSETRQARLPPKDWTICEIQPCFDIKSIWIMNKDFGLTIEMTDALICEQSLVCPFEC